MPVKKKVIKKTALAPTVLIAGGAGFIGSNLAEALLLKDARVIVLDNFKTGKKSYVDHLIKNPKFALFDCDISQGLPEEIGSVDYIFHLAGLESYTFSEKDVNLDALLTNALGTKNLLDLANSSPAKFLLVSSLNVYQGVIANINLDQYFGQTNQEEKKYSLNEAKRFAEALVWEYYKKNSSDVRVIRLPEVYGPNMDLESCGNLGVLFKNLINKEELAIYGDGLEKEYYLYITDAVSGIIKALFGKNTEGKIFSLVGKEPYSVLEISYMLKSVAEGDTQVVFKPKPPTFSYFDYKEPDTQTLALLKWEPKVPLKEGTIKTLTWLGYKVNQHSFKPAKLIEQKIKESALQKESTLAIEAPSNISTSSVEQPEAEGGLMSLADIKETPADVPTSIPTPAPEPQILTTKNLPIPSPVQSSIQQPLPKTLPTVETPAVQLNHIVLESSGGRKISKVKTMAAVASLLLSFLLVFAGLPIADAYVNSKKAVAELEKIPAFMGQLDSDSSKESANNAFQSFNKAQNSIARVKWIFLISGNSKQYESVTGLLSSAQYFSKAAYNLSKAANPFDEIWDIMRPTSETKLNKEEFDKSLSEVSTAKNNLQLAQAEFKVVQPQYLPTSMYDKVQKYEEMLNKSTEMLNVVTNVATAVPDLMGLEKPKKYMLIFQNSNEIRPTGGFIGSYAIVELNQGKISNMTIDDIYNPDGQIDVRNIKVKPPKVITDLLKEDKMYMRNSNWNPDFPSSANDIQNLYYKVTGEKVDGVFAVDLYFVKNLLNVTGPVFLTAYNEKIDSNNLYERSQFYSEFNYKDGSDQKRSFLTVLGSKLIERIFALPKDQMPQLFSEMDKALTEKHLLLYLSGNPLAAMFNEKGWDGALAKTDGDYLYVVNANMGGTKANYFVENTMNYKVSSLTRDGLLRAELNLNYKHSGQDNAWPGGPYTDYVRLLTQYGSKLTGAKIINNDGTEKDIFKEIVISKEGVYNSFETKFVLNPKEEVKLVFYYDLPQNLSINPDLKSYKLFIQKQPGTDKDKFNFEFNPPFGLNVDVYTPDMLLENGVVKSNLMLNKDTQLFVNLK